MSEVLRRCWLVIAVGKSSCRCARVLRRELPAQQLALIAIRNGGKGKLNILVKPLARSAWRATVCSTIPSDLLDRLTETARSVRDQVQLIRLFGPAFSAITSDVLVLFDFTDMQCAKVYRLLADRIGSEESLRRSPISGLRLLTLLPGPAGRQSITKEAVRVLQKRAGDSRPFIDHTIIFHPSNLDSSTRCWSELADLAGKGLGSILKLGFCNPVRVLLGPPPQWLPPRMLYWSLGYAEIDCSAKHILKQALSRYATFLGQLWCQSTGSKLAARQEANTVLSRLIESDIAAAELPGNLAKWLAEKFLLKEASLSDSSRLSLADSELFLTEFAKEVAAKSQSIWADLPNFRAISPRPIDPRGWLKKLLNWLSGGRIYRWQCNWSPLPDMAEINRTRLLRLASLDTVLMNSQIALQRTIKTLRKTAEQTPLVLALHNQFAELSADGLIHAAHRKVRSGINANHLAQMILEGNNPLDVFLDGFTTHASCAAGIDSGAPVAQLDSLSNGKNDWLRHILDVLTELATPWWAELIDPRAQEHTFVYLPKDYFAIASEVIPARVRALEWKYESCAALSLLQGCVPGELESAVEQSEPAVPRHTRHWIAGAALDQGAS